MGSEGYNGCEGDIELWKEIHSYPDVDYATIHIWPYNWSWITPATVNDSVSVACAKTDEYIDCHFDALYKALVDSGATMKPIVLEEFGYPRDEMATAKGSSVNGRDAYYAHVFDKVIDGGKIAGVNFWAGEVWPIPPTPHGNPAMNTPAIPLRNPRASTRYLHPTLRQLKSSNVRPQKFRAPTITDFFIDMPIITTFQSDYNVI